MGTVEQKNPPEDVLKNLDLLLHLDLILAEKKWGALKDMDMVKKDEPEKKEDVGEGHGN